MKPKELQQQLAALQIAYEDALLKKSPPEEIKKILMQIEELTKKIAMVTGDRLH